MFVPFVLENVGVDVYDKLKEFDGLDNDMFVPVLGLSVDIGSCGRGGGGGGEGGDVLLFGWVVFWVVFWVGDGRGLVIFYCFDFELSITIFLI